MLLEHSQRGGHVVPCGIFSRTTVFFMQIVVILALLGFNLFCVVFFMFFSLLYCVGEKGRAEMHSVCLLLVIKVMALFQLACWSVKSGTFTRNH